MKRKVFTKLAAFAASGLVSIHTAHGDTQSDRILALERQMEELKSSERTDNNSTGIGGYGELHYNSLSGKGGADSKKEIDFHRFVLFFHHNFSDTIRFQSELELEHSVSGGDEPGEVELEQAFIDMDVNKDHTFRSGLFLLPIGLLNTTHEPTRFYGVERNPVEKNIIPTTWWESGAGVLGNIGEYWAYEAYLHSGLKTSTNSPYSVRDGRQKVAEADASDPAATVAVKWTRPGISIGASLNYQNDITQGTDPEAGQAFLGEIHAELKRGALGLRALYAEWSLDGSGPESTGADRQSGWYIEPSYRVNDAFGFFIRCSEWNNRAGADNSDSLKRQWDAGVNWRPVEQVVIKADYQLQDNRDNKNQDGLNLGIGYEF